MLKTSVSGFCPYVSSFYVSKSASELQSINKEECSQIKDPKYGDYQVYNATMENSRSGTGILTAWTVMNRFGISGFQKYLAYLLTTSMYMRNKIINSYSDHFEVLNNFASGQCIMLRPKFTEVNLPFKELLNASQEEKKTYNDYCSDFYKHISFELCQSKNKKIYPLLGVLTKYRQRTLGSDITAIRILPSSVYLNKKICDKLLELIIETKLDFEKIRNKKIKNFSDFEMHEHQPR